MKVKHLLLIIIVITLGIFSFIKIKNIYETNKKEISTSNEEEITNNSGLALMYETNSGTYKSTTVSRWPILWYKINETLSKCENNGTISWDGYNITVKNATSDRCYVYFDKTFDSSKKDCTIKINFEKSNTDFRLYRVASIDDDVMGDNNNLHFKLVDLFTNYSVEVNDLDASGYSNLALTLANYVSADNLTATQVGTTDENGTNTFENLETGMYLLVGETVTETGTKDGELGNYVYIPTSTIIEIPIGSLNYDDTFTINYDIDVTVMYSQSWISDEEEY